MPTAEVTKEFATVDILSLLTGVMLSDDKGRGMKELMSYIIGSPSVNWLGLPNAQQNVASTCRRTVLDQYPLLSTYTEFPRDADIDTWVGEANAALGAQMAVIPI